MGNTLRWRESFPLWGALLLGSAAWSVHLIFSYFLVEASCTDSASPGSRAGSAVWITLIVVTAVTVIAALMGAAFAWGRRRTLQRGGPGLERAAGLSSVVVALSLFFALVILLELTPILFLACEST